MKVKITSNKAPQTSGICIAKGQGRLCYSGRNVRLIPGTFGMFVRVTDGSYARFDGTRKGEGYFSCKGDLDFHTVSNTDKNTSGQLDLMTPKGRGEKRVGFAHRVQRNTATSLDAK